MPSLVVGVVIVLGNDDFNDDGRAPGPPSIPAARWPSAPKEATFAKGQTRLLDQRHMPPLAHGALVLYDLFASAASPAPALPPTVPPWSSLPPDQQAELLAGGLAVLSREPGRTRVLALDPRARSPQVVHIDLQALRALVPTGEPTPLPPRTSVTDIVELARGGNPAAWDELERHVRRLVAAQVRRVEGDHGHELEPEARRELVGRLVPKAFWLVYRHFTQLKSPTPATWLLSRRGPLGNEIRSAIRKELRASRSPPPAPPRRDRRKREKPDALLLACRAGMLAHLDADPLAMAFLHGAVPPKFWANQPGHASYRSTRRRLEALRQQARGWAQRRGYEPKVAERAFPSRCPGYVEPTGASTVEALRELERRPLAPARSAA